MLFKAIHKPQHLKAKDSIWRKASQKQDLGPTSKLHICKRTATTSLQAARYHQTQAHKTSEKEKKLSVAAEHFPTAGFN